MPDIKRRHFTKSVHFREYFQSVHQAGALDAKTKELMHLALVLALHCEP